MHDNQEPYFEEGEIFEVINKYERMLKNNTMCYFDVYEFETIVDYYLDEHSFRAAYTAVEKALTQHPYSTSLKFKLSQILIHTGKPTKGVRILREIESLESSNSDFYLVLGSALNLLGKKEEAQSAFDKAIKLATDDKDELIYNIAYSYINTRRYKLAVKYLELALKVNESNTTVLHELALVYERLDDLKKSIKYYKKYLDIDPFAENIWLNLGLIYTSTDKIEEAIKAFDYAIAITPNYVSAYFSKANTLVNASRYKEAILTYKNIVILEPNNVQALTYIGECYEKLSFYKRAIYYYQKALHIDETYSDAWYGIGMSNFQLKKYGESLNCFSRANQIDPENPEYWFMLGEVYKKLDIPDKSAEAFNRTVELDPNDYEAWISRADISFRKSNLKDAIKILNKAYQYNHDISTINYQLATYYLLNNQPRIAYRYFEKGLSINFKEHSEHLIHIPDNSRTEIIYQLINKYKNKSQQSS